MAMSKAQHAWTELNIRQQTYLRLLYDADQALEQERQDLAARGHWSSTPARVWRRIEINSRYSPVWGRLSAAGFYDCGTGSTLAALTTRGLIETATDHASGVVSAWMTRPGRAAVRAGLGIAPVARKPKWALSEWMWRAMIKVAETGQEGLLTSQLWTMAQLHLTKGQEDMRRGARPYLDVRVTYVRYVHRDFSGKPYDPPSYGTKDIRRFHFTEEGRAHYVEHLAAYRDLYPDIAAPEIPASESKQPG
ncbi:hypothetical protein ACFV1C_00640 [Streptomyces sp. NPDC059605]|uniref:hypothetical protein n=1 Tax=Streptomyces sp. NPDC059605 TaxID=3346882 RepID=UPI00369888CA